MKSIIKGFAGAGLLMLGLASCSENSWNDHLDGFESGPNLSDVQSISYTLTDADYARFANNRFNKALAAQNGEDAVKALAAVASNHYITDLTPADTYMPNLLNDSLFSYFTLSNGSAINVTYKAVGEMPETMIKLNGAPSYEVSEADYQSVYGSDKNYCTSFTPSHPSSGFIPGFLKKNFPDARSGDYVMVGFNDSDVDPSFDAPSFDMTDVINSRLTTGEEIEVKGIVSGTCTRGFILSDKGGSILVYGNSYVAGTYSIGDQLVVKGTTASYKNCLQIAYDSATITMSGKGSYEYPEETVFTPDYLIQAGQNTMPIIAKWGRMAGQVQVSGNYINLAFDGRTDVRGSIYYVDDNIKSELTDGRDVILHGYFTQTSQSGDITNANIVVVSVESATNKSLRRKGTRMVTVPSTPTIAAYIFNGSNWTPAVDNIVVIQPSDYTAMGLTYGNFSGTQALDYLPIFLKNKYPYAQKDKEVYVAYKYFADKVTNTACALWRFDGSKWYDKIASDGVQEITTQFVKRDGAWKQDPSIEITLPAGKGQSFSAAFYQKCVDWVLKNVPDGDKYVTSYGNNDYYTGASAYQNNIDLRASAARTQYSAAYEGMSDEEVVALMKKRFEDEVCPGVLKELYPDIAPMGDFKPTITIHFYTYNGSTSAQTIVYEVVGKGEFKFVSCTWND